MPILQMGSSLPRNLCPNVHDSGQVCRFQGKAKTVEISGHLPDGIEVKNIDEFLSFVNYVLFFMLAGRASL
jgi:hypothetical protein